AALRVDRTVVHGGRAAHRRGERDGDRVGDVRRRPCHRSERPGLPRHGRRHAGLRERRRGPFDPRRPRRRPSARARGPARADARDARGLRRARGDLRAAVDELRVPAAASRGGGPQGPRLILSRHVERKSPANRPGSLASVTLLTVPVTLAQLHVSTLAFANAIHHRRSRQRGRSTAAAGGTGRVTAELSLVGRILAIAFASGLNVYVTVAVLGLASRLGWGPTLPPGLRGLEDGVVIASATLLFLVEFILDKVPHVDSLWDAIHTFIRPMAAALLAFAATDGVPVAIRIGVATLAGVTALASHGTNVGLRLALNPASRRLARLIASLGEDAAAIAIAVTALLFPETAPAVAAAILAVLLFFGPGLWRPFVFGIRAIAAR